MLWDSPGYAFSKGVQNVNYYLPYCNNLSYHFPLGVLLLIKRARVLVVLMGVKNQFWFLLVFGFKRSKVEAFTIPFWVLGQNDMSGDI